MALNINSVGILGGFRGDIEFLAKSGIGGGGFGAIWGLENSCANKQRGPHDIDFVN